MHSLADRTCYNPLVEPGGGGRRPPKCCCCAALPEEGGRPGRLLSGWSDGRLRVWDLQQRQPVMRLGRQGWKVTCCAAVERSKAVSGSDDGAVWVWDLEAGACDVTLRGHADTVWGVAAAAAATPAGGRPGGVAGIASASQDGMLRLWDTRQPNDAVAVLGANCGPFERREAFCVCWTPDSRAVVGGHGDGLRVWDAAMAGRGPLEELPAGGCVWSCVAAVLREP